MPFDYRKIRGKDLYKVFNKETGAIHSEGSTLDNAKKQIKLLYMLENKKKPIKGGATVNGAIAIGSAVGTAGLLAIAKYIFDRLERNNQVIPEEVRNDVESQLRQIAEQQAQERQPISTNHFAESSSSKSSSSESLPSVFDLSPDSSPDSSSKSINIREPKSTAARGFAKDYFENSYPKLQKSLNGTGICTNKWIEHVKSFSKKHNIKYSEALKDPKCKASYKK